MSIKIDLNEGSLFPCSGLLYMLADKTVVILFYLLALLLHITYV